MSSESSVPKTKTNKNQNNNQNKTSRYMVTNVDSGAGWYKGRGYNEILDRFFLLLICSIWPCTFLILYVLFPCYNV